VDFNSSAEIPVILFFGLFVVDLFSFCQCERTEGCNIEETCFGGTWTFFKQTIFSYYLFLFVNFLSTKISEKMKAIFLFFKVEKKNGEQND
jgi:hypothetical protein